MKEDRVLIMSTKQLLSPSREKLDFYNQILLFVEIWTVPFHSALPCKMERSRFHLIIILHYCTHIHPILVHYFGYDSLLV